MILKRFWVLLLGCVVLASCSRYPPADPPPNALSRAVSTQIDKGIGEGKYLLYVWHPNGDIPGHTGPKLKEGGYALTFGDDTRIEFSDTVTVEGTRFEKGTKLVKKNGWWCRP